MLERTHISRRAKAILIPCRLDHLMSWKRFSYFYDGKWYYSQQWPSPTPELNPANQPTIHLTVCSNLLLGPNLCIVDNDTA